MLNEFLKGARITDCFTQNKNELIVSFHLVNSTEIFHLRADQNPEFAIINFPKTFYRARKNNVSLFPVLQNQVVEKVEVIPNDRSFRINFTEELTLLFKFHGNQSNIILYKSVLPISVFRKKLVKDHKLLISSLERQLDFSKEFFIEKNGNLENYPTLGPFLKKYLSEKFQHVQDINEKWNLFSETINELREGEIYLINYSGRTTLSLVNTGKIIASFNNPMDALNEFTRLRKRELDFESAYKHAKNLLLQEQKKLHQSLQTLETATEKIISSYNYQLFADLIMANLNSIDPFDEEVILHDFNTNEPIKISLKKGVSPQKNAENYYRKSKNQNIQINRNTELIQQKKQGQSMISQALSKLEVSKTVDEISAIISPFEKLKLEKDVHVPYKVYHFMNFEIRVGRNAKSNDLTTFKHSYKEDLWLHVKDASGSHVIVKYKSGQNFPKPVIEKAAKLAAQNSKRKNETVVPVSYTAKKFVRKRKGDPAGSVILEKEQVILVEPER